MTAQSGTPTRQEIKEQLSRMLGCPRFRNAPNQAAFLKLAVERALEGKKTPGRIVASVVFGVKFIRGCSTDVRVTAANLRATLRKYNAEHGAEDLVVIALPPPPGDISIKLPEGEAYTPEFFYNPLHPVSTDFRLGEHFRMHAIIKDDLLALHHFGEALKTAPDHIEAAMGVFETYFDLLAWGLHHSEIDQSLRDIMIQSTELLQRATREGSKYWRVWAASGMDLERVSQQEDAKVAFTLAYHLDRARTERFEPFLAFLVGMGESEEAVGLARSHYLKHRDDIHACLMYARILCSAKRFPEAVEVAQQAWQLDNGHFEANRLLAEARISQGRYDDALAHVQMVRMLADSLTLIKVGLIWSRSCPALPDRIKSHLLPPALPEQLTLPAGFDAPVQL